MSRTRPKLSARQKMSRHGLLYAIRVLFTALILALLVVSDTVCRNQPVAHAWLLLSGAAYPHIGHLLFGRFGGRRGKAMLVMDGLFAGSVMGAIGLFSPPSAVLAAISLFNWTIIGGPLLVAMGMLAALAGIALSGAPAISPIATYNCISLDALSAFVLIGYFSTIGLFMFRYIGELRLQQADLQATADAAHYSRSIADLALLGVLPPSAASNLANKGAISSAVVNDATLLLVEFMWPRGEAPAITDLADCFQISDNIFGRHGLEGVKSFGRYYLAMSHSATGPDDAVMATQELSTYLNDHRALIHAPAAQRSIRAVLHFGSINTGLVQPERLNFDMLGNTVEALNALASKAARQPAGTLVVSVAAYRQLQNSADFAAAQDYSGTPFFLLPLLPVP